MLECHRTPTCPFSPFHTPYRKATNNPERVASPATYLLISKALIAAEAGLAVDEADALAGLEDVADAVALAGLTEEEADVVIVALAGLVEDKITIVLLFAGFEEVYRYSQYQLTLR
jgi:hypothetical protein